MNRLHLLLLLLVSLAACLDTTDSNYSTQLVEIDLLEIKESAQVNEEISVRVRTKPYNGCWSNLQVSLLHGDMRHIVLVAAGTVKSGDMCPENLVREDTTIVFRPTRTGQYYFQANAQPFTVLRDTLEVE